jgi:GT2 family glycosyltransferase
MQKPFVVIPNWNGADCIRSCLDSLRTQSLPPHIIVVDNGSVDQSIAIIEAEYPEIELIKHPKNLGFSGGVNAGFRHALSADVNYVASFNNDAVADRDWLLNLSFALNENPEIGIAACKLVESPGEHLDSTGEFYTIWGLPYPRGRGETNLNKYDQELDVFAASGGASLYRVSMLKEIGLFDEDFFAYYEDVDLSFRAQLAGWKVRYVPSAVAYHQIGATSSKIKGFTTYQTIKNLPQLLWKNVPWSILIRVWPRLALAFSFFVARALLRFQIIAVVKGFIVGGFLWFKKLPERRRIQKSRTVSDEYVWSMLVHDLPPNAHNLRRLRSIWWKLRGKHV